MIIIEGPDGSGKSTLIKRMQDQMGLELAPRACTSKGGPVTNLAEWVDRDLLSWGTRPVQIYDRYPLLSEPIYGPLIQGGLASKFDNPGWLRARTNTMRHMALVVWCLPPVHVVEKNVDAQENQSEWEMSVADDISAVYALYSVFANTYIGHGMTYDYTAGNARPRDTHLANLVQNHLKTWRHF